MSHGNDPKCRVWALRGVTHYLAGRNDHAIADFNEALRLNPSHASSYFNRGNAMRAKGMIREAIADYLKVLEINPALTLANQALQQLKAAA
jgi:tetratricopeptide (TPR) repeat protein